MNWQKLFKKTENTSPNGRFGASGGVARPTLECRTATSALVQTAVESPACAKPLGRCAKAGDNTEEYFKKVII